MQRSYTKKWSPFLSKNLLNFLATFLFFFTVSKVPYLKANCCDTIAFSILSPDSNNIVNISKKSEIFTIEFSNVKTSSKQKIRIYDPSLHIFEFSKQFPQYFLLGGKHQIKIYNSSKAKLSLIKQYTSKQNINFIGFSLKNEKIFWATKQEVFSSNNQFADKKKILSFSKKISSFSILTDDQIAISLDKEKDVKIFNDKGELKNDLVGHQNSIIQTLKRGDSFASLDSEKNLFFWNIEKNKIQKKISLQSLNTLPNQEIDSVDILSDNKIIRVLKQEGIIHKAYDFSLDKLDYNSNSIKKRSPIKVFKSSSIQTFQIKNSSERKQLETEHKLENWKENLFHMFELGSYQQTLDAINQLEKEKKNDSDILQLKKDSILKIESQQLYSIAKQLADKKNITPAIRYLYKSLDKNPFNQQSILLLKKIESQKEQNLYFYLSLGILLSALIAVYFIAKKKFLRKFIWKNSFSKSILTKLFKPLSTPEPSTTARHEFTAKLSKKLATIKRHKKALSFLQYKEQLEEMEKTIVYLNINSQKKNKDLNTLIKQLDLIEDEIGKIETLVFKKNKTEKTNFSQKKESSKHQKEEKKKNPNEQKLEQNIENYYQILGLKKSFSQNELKKSFREKLQTYHPDKHNNSDFEWVKQQAADMTAKIQEAYQTLSDPKKKKQYDSIILKDAK